jgi:hypothetical protein
MEKSEAAIGVNVFWTIPTNKVAVADVKEAAAKHGFDAEDIKEPSDRKVFSRASKALNNGQQRRLVRRISDAPGKSTVIGIVDESVEAGSEQLEYTQSTTVRFDKTDSTVNADGSLASEFLDEFEGLKGVLTHQDFRRFVRRTVRECNGIPKRPSGGIYFIPTENIGMIERCAEMYNELGVGTIYVERIFDGPQERRIVWESAEGEINKMVDSLLSKVSKIEKRAGAMKGQGERMAELQNMMTVYTKITGSAAEAEAISERLEEATAIVASKMSDLQGIADAKTETKSVAAAAKAAGKAEIAAVKKAAKKKKVTKKEKAEAAA